MIPGTGLPPVNFDTIHELVEQKRKSKQDNKSGIHGVRVGLDENNQLEFEEVDPDDQLSAIVFGIKEKRLTRYIRDEMTLRGLDERTIKKIDPKIDNSDFRRIINTLKDSPRTLAPLTSLLIKLINIESLTQESKLMRPLVEKMLQHASQSDARELLDVLHNNQNRSQAMSELCTWARRYTPPPLRASFLTQVHVPECPASGSAIEASQEIGKALNTTLLGNADRKEKSLMEGLAQASELMRTCNTHLSLASAANIVKVLASKNSNSLSADEQPNIQLIKSSIAQVKTFFSNELTTKLIADLKSLSAQLVEAGSKGEKIDIESTVNIIIYCNNVMRTLDDEARKELSPALEWIAKLTTYIGCQTELPPVSEKIIEQLRLSQDGLKQLGVALPRPAPCSATSTHPGLAMRQPLGINRKIEFEPEDKQLQMLRSDFANLKRGLPVRYTPGYNFQPYLNAVEVKEGQLLDQGLSSLAEYRPVTYLFEKSRTKVYTPNGIVIGYLPEQLSPWAVFKKNAYTNAFINVRDRDAVNRLADDRRARGAKRLMELKELGHKMIEKSKRYASLDKRVLTSSHFDTTSGQWTQPKPVKSDTLRCTPLPHNEVVVAPILPQAIGCQVHHLAPENFTGNRSPFWELGTRLDCHKQIERDIAQTGINKKLPFIVYDPVHGSIREAGFYDQVVPEELRQEMDFQGRIRNDVRRLETSCQNCGIDKNHLEKLLVRIPLKRQLTFLTQPRQFSGSHDQACHTIFNQAFKPAQLPEPSHNALRAPDNPAVTTQNLLEQHFYCPRTEQELKQCLTTNLLPENLPDRIPPEEAIRRTIHCEWFCQLLETEGFAFSQQEQLLLQYASLLSDAGTPKQAAELLKTTFKPHFDPLVLDAVTEALEGINNRGYSDKPRVELFQRILKFSSRLSEYCKGGSAKKVTAPYLKNKEQLDALGVPVNLLRQDKFAERLQWAIQGSIDLLQVTGESGFDDRREQQRFDIRHRLAPLNREMDKKRQNRFRISPNLWNALHEQLQENCKRQICLNAEQQSRRTSPLVTQTSQLDAFDLPFSFNCLDLVSSGSDEIRQVLSPLHRHIAKNGLARPTGNLEVREFEKLYQDEGMMKAYGNEISKRPTTALLDSIKSPLTVK